MIIYLLTFLCLVGFALYLTGPGIRKQMAQPWKLLLRAGLAGSYLLVLGYGIVQACGVEQIQEIAAPFFYSTDDMSLYGLWLFLSVLFLLIPVFCLRLRKNSGYVSFPVKMRKIALGLQLFSFFLCCCGFALDIHSKTSLRISEVCSYNSGFYANAFGMYPDYIEIHNPTVFPVSLKGLYLTEDPENPPDPLGAEIVVPGGGYAIVWADGHQLPFRLAKGGENLYLLSSSLEVLDAVAVPALPPNTVYARNAITQNWQVQNATAMAVNSTREKGPQAPVFSAEGGFYEEAFALSLDAPEDCRIYYTLDSSTPDETALEYTQPIWVQNVCDAPNVYRAAQRIVYDWKEYVPEETVVDKAFVVRAVAIDSQGSRSDVVTNSYFVDMDSYRDKTVLSLVSDPEGLFGPDGIYVTGSAYDAWYLGGQEGDRPEPNFRGHGPEFEVDAHAELFGQTKRLMSQPIGLRLQGAGTRTSVGKRFSLYSRPKFSGSRYFSYELFGRRTHSMFTRKEFADVLTSKLIEGLGIGGLDAVAAEVFLDGEFWYSCYLRERYDETYVAEEFSVKEEAVELVKEVPEEIYEFLEDHPLSEAENYAALNQIMDIRSYAAFLASNIYLGNLDTSEFKNLRLWRSRGYSGLDLDDNRWRFLVYDTDAIAWDVAAEFGGLAHTLNTFSVSRPFTDPSPSYNTDPLFVAMKESPQFRQLFVLTFLDLANTCFEKEHVAAVLTDLGDDRTWNDSFFDLRFDCIVPFLAQEFDLTGTLETVTLKNQTQDMGSVQINSVIPTMAEGIWSGQYFTDYPVTLTAAAKPGYEFVAWHHGGETYSDSTLQVTPVSGDSLWEAEFRKIGEVQ